MNIENVAENKVFINKYEKDGLLEIGELRFYSSYEKCIALLNVCKLIDLSKDFSFSINPENLYLDSSLRVYVIKYKREHNKEARERNIKELKSIIAYILGKYNFSDYFEGGDDLFEKEIDEIIPSLLPIFKAKSLSDIELFLLKATDLYKKNRDSKFILIDRKKEKIYRKVSPILIVITIISLILSSYLFFFQNLKNKKLINAYGYYIEGEFDKVAETLSSIKANKLPYETKIILAKSYISMESFTNKNANVQREKISNSINAKTDDKYLMYWIEVGRLNFDEAIDLAKQLSDNELLYYALIKQKDTVNKDSSISGSEKENKLSKINGQLETLKKKLSENTEATEDKSKKEITLE